MPDPLTILIAVICGLASRAIALPALVGYLGAGFVLHTLRIDSGPLLHHLSELGITLLLFTIGLKLRPTDLLHPRVWGTALTSMAFMLFLFAGLLSLTSWLLSADSFGGREIFIVAFALTFSSTVYVIQAMQDRGETASDHAQLATGILIIQDLAAVVFLAVSTGTAPRFSALLLLALIPMRRPLLRLLGYCGHGELFTLLGFLLALGGATLFDLAGIKGDLGALAVGMLLAGHQKSKELARNLLQFKDLFIVGFFLNIGLQGWPAPQMIGIGIALGALSLLKPLLFFPLMTRLHTPSRTALLSAFALANLSEFGIIVIALAATAGLVDAQWSGTLSIAVAVSFILNTPLTRRAHNIYKRWHDHLRRYESAQVRANYPDTSGVRIIVLGMGNIGTGAYDNVARRSGRQVLGVDENRHKLAHHRRVGRRVVEADASDPDFWRLVDLDSIEMVLLALTNHQENLRVSALLHELGYRGKITAVVRFAEEALELERIGVTAFNLYTQAGTGFADHALHSMGVEAGAPE